MKPPPFPEFTYYIISSNKIWSCNTATNCIPKWQCYFFHARLVTDLSIFLEIKFFIKMHAVSKKINVAEIYIIKTTKLGTQSKHYQQTNRAR